MTELIVQNDLKVKLCRLNQQHTYSGLSDGPPFERINNELLKRTIEEAKRFNNPIHLIDPVLTPIPYEGKYPFGDPVSLPQITCIADLLCFKAAKGSGDYSVLTVVWLQEDYAFPIDNKIILSLKELEWDKFAEDHYWADY